MSKELIGFSWNRKHFVFGVVLAGLFLFLNFAIAGFSLAIPSLPQSSTAGQYAVSGFAMPIFEEVFFRVVIPALLFFVGLRFFTTALVSSGVFAGFHYFVYTVGGYVAKTSPFISAFFFGMATMYVTYRLTNNILTALVFHVVVNLTLLATFAII